ncbi:unnamed protein product [Withania somnifera]
MKEGEITPGITSEEYMHRRKKLLEFLPENSLAIVAAAPTKMMTDVVPYNFRQVADYLYINGCQQPGGVAVLGHDCGLCIFMPEPSLKDVLWQGEVAGVDAALQIFKADLAYPISRLPEMRSRMIESSSNVFHNVKMTTLSYMELEAYRKAVNNCKVKDFSVYTHEARLVKSPAELKLMRDSASIACRALIQTMLYSKLFPDEGILSAKFEYECRARGAQRMAFNPVVGGGPNGSIIHYSHNDQKELYDLILETNKECKRLRRGFKEIGILKNDWRGRYEMLNPTSIGHYLGMDVHDSSAIGCDRPLKSGVVITIEPGVYIPSSFDCPERFRGIGIRIEDEVLITESGYEVLTASIPKEIKHLESLLNNFGSGRGIDTRAALS